MSRKIGSEAEEKAARFLEGLGYSILDRNFSCRWGEIDIVAREGDTVVFVEVRSRNSSSFGVPAETVIASKRRKLIQTARVYAAKKGLDCPLRFDVIAFEAGRLEHISDAFSA